jgi:hypothetical protein
MLPFWFEAAKMVLGIFKLMEVVAEVFALPPYAYIRETGALERNVLS